MARFLRELLKGVLSDWELSLVVASFDIIGDIAIVKLPDELLPKKHLIGRALINELKQVRTVLRQVSGFSGEFRTRELEYLAGEKKFEVLYKERGCEFHVDLAATYFSPRLGHERSRIADLVEPGETVVNLFGGVGTFAMLIAKKQPNCRVYTIDLNPRAHQLAIENTFRNKVADRVVPVYGDSREIARKYLAGTADRVLMPLPDRAKEFVETAVTAIKQRGGIIHYYTLIRTVRGKDPLALAAKELSNRLKVPHHVEMAKVVTEAGPRVLEVVQDVRLLGR